MALLINTDPHAASGGAIALDKASGLPHRRRQLAASAEDLDAAVHAVGAGESKLRDYVRRHAPAIEHTHTHRASRR